MSQFIGDVLEKAGRITTVLALVAVGMVTSAAVGPRAQAQIAVDAVSTAINITGNGDKTFSHTTSGNYRLMLVGVSIHGTGIVSSVTYNGVSLTNVGVQANGSSARTEIWRLVAPATGTHNVVVTFASMTEDASLGIITFTGVHQTTPLGTFASTSGSSTSASVNVSSATGELVFDHIAVINATVTVGSGQVQRWNVMGSEARAAGSTEPGATTTTMSWSRGTSGPWSIGAVSIKPVFTDITSSASLAGISNTYGVAWGDYNNDGYPDLYVSVANALYRNDGDGTFSAGPALTGNGRATHWADYDNDGNLDFFATSDAQLSLNNGNNTFTLQNNATIGITFISNLGDVSWLDYDNDGDLDIFAHNGTTSGNYIYSNDGDGTFTTLQPTGLNATSGNGEVTGVADYDGDGDTDILFRIGSTVRLYRNNGDNTFTEVVSFGISDDGGGYNGMAWGDYDHDGDLDLFVAHANSANQLFRNNGNSTFTDIAASVGLNDAASNYGAVWADYDLDGDLDLFVGGSASNSKLFLNTQDDTDYLKVKVTGEGAGFSAKDGTGARVELYNSSGTTLHAVRELFGAEGFGSHSQRIQHFGLASAWGDGSGTYTVKVIFPSGTTVTRSNVVPTSESIVIGSTTLNNTIEITEVDTTAPAAPVVTAPASPTNDTTPVISGTASEDGGTITLTSDIDGVLAPTATVTGGTWSIQLTSVLSVATHSITATHTDAAGNTSPVSGAVTLVVNNPPAAVASDVQSGTTTFTSVSTDVTIASVDLTKSFLVFSYTVDDEGPSQFLVRGDLTSSTNIHFERAGATGSPIVTIAWYVAEFTSGVTVQRGNDPNNTETVNIPITAVDLSESFPLISWQNTGSTWGDDDGPRARLTSSTNLELDAVRVISGNVNWQVIEYDGAVVQRGQHTLGTADVSATVAIAAVDLAKSFVIVSNTNGASGFPDDLGIQAEFSATNQLTFTRGSTGPLLEINWVVVEFTDAESVQSGSATFGAGATVSNIPITSVDLSKSIAFLSQHQRGGQGNVATPDNPGHVWFAADLTCSTTNLQLTRALGSSGSTAEVEWFVVEFSGSSDTTSPTAPVVTAPASPTNDTTPVISGTASEDGGTITLTSDLDGVLAPTTTVAAGAWSITLTTVLSEGTHSITATHTDAAGNTSSVSGAVTLVVDTTAPTAPVVTAPSSPTNDTTPVISGTASEDGGTITLTSDLDGVLAPTTTVAGGAWSITLTTVLTEGTHALTATHTDAAGNVSAASG
ncbi:MAG: VCBS repeat-containing protein, partial [Bacteroidetes bacterium]|nr:VCBS repeat-containing protein [Bacteroidota bacterium]